jgi:hypothetical protein
MAAQVLRAITATPPSGLKCGGAALASIWTTLSTPGTFRLRRVVTLSTLPP